MALASFLIGEVSFYKSDSYKWLNSLYAFYIQGRRLTCFSFYYNFVFVLAHCFVYMISSAIWDKSARVNFSKTNKIARARRASAICRLRGIYPKLHEKIM